LGVIGLEMEGSYYQKPFNLLQIRKSVPKDIRLDMHIMHQITFRNRRLTSGGLGTTGLNLLI
jgi:hypothetical protein